MWIVCSLRDFAVPPNWSSPDNFVTLLCLYCRGIRFQSPALSSSTSESFSLLHPEPKLRPSLPDELVWGRGPCPGLVCLLWRHFPGKTKKCLQCVKSAAEFCTNKLNYTSAMTTHSVPNVLNIFPRQIETIFSTIELVQSFTQLGYLFV